MKSFRKRKQKKQRNEKQESRIRKNIMDLMRKYITLPPVVLGCRFDMLLLLEEKKGRFFRFDGAKMIP